MEATGRPPSARAASVTDAGPRVSAGVLASVERWRAVASGPGVAGGGPLRARDPSEPRAEDPRGAPPAARRCRTERAVGCGTRRVPRCPDDGSRAAWREGIVFPADPG